LTNRIVRLVQNNTSQENVFGVLVEKLESMSLSYPLFVKAKKKKILELPSD